MATVSPRAPVVKKAGPVVVSLDDPSVIKHGWLVKQGGAYKSWKKRYFILSGRNNFRQIVLSYHKKPNEHAIDELNLEGAMIELSSIGASLNFKPKGVHRVYVFKSANDEMGELEAWFKILSEYTIKLEDALFPANHTVVSSDHIYSVFSTRLQTPESNLKIFLSKLGIDPSLGSMDKDPLSKLLHFLPALRKESPTVEDMLLTSPLELLANSPPSNTVSYWARLMCQPWFLIYHDNLTVYRILKHKEIGAFVVRFGRFADVFVLSVKILGEVIHLPIYNTPTGYSLPNAPAFPSIYGVLRNYVNQPLPNGISLLPFTLVGLDEHAFNHRNPPLEETPKVTKKRDSANISTGSGKKAPKEKKTTTVTTDAQYTTRNAATSMSYILPDAPPSFGPIPEFTEPPPSLSTPDIPSTLTTVHSSARLTTSWEVPATPSKTYAEPWKIPNSMKGSEGWRDKGLSRRLLLQKGIKVFQSKEMEQLGAILRILAPEGPLRIRKCYAIENSRLLTLFEANNSFLEAKMKSYEPKWNKEDPTGARAETIQVMDQLAGKCQWNNGKNLKIIPMIYYASEEKLATAEGEGFDKQQENPDGPYGAGYYLTKNIDEARLKGHGGPFLITFAVPGRTYPVIEPPISPNDLQAAHQKKGRASVSGNVNTLYGKPVKDGYDSHFVRTCGGINDDPQTGKVYNSSWTGQEWDQLVLFATAQAVPRYLVYLE